MLFVMATQFKPSILVSDVFGSAGDVTAVHRGGKTFLRKKAHVGRTPTPAQASHLEVHRRALAAWRTVPQEIQEVWNTYGAEVEPHRPPFDHLAWISGQNLFVSAYHGFYTLGREHVPEPIPFESFPPFVPQALGASDIEGALELRFFVSGLDLVDGARYWLYGTFQVMWPGKGKDSRISKRTVLATGPSAGSSVTMRVPDWLDVWPEVEGLPVIQIMGNFVLLDEVTGYRSQKSEYRLMFYLS